MRKLKYTKSRLHEKLNKIGKTCCSILVVSLIGLVVSKSIQATAITASTQEYELDTIYGVERQITYSIIEKEESIQPIRCTVYCDTGYTASGAWTTEGCLAGKREWLGKTCRLYRMNKDGSQGECIGTFVFKDTGFGLDELNNVCYNNGTIANGVSIDMWHPTEDECWDWVKEYGDYVYMEFVQ